MPMPTVDLKSFSVGNVSDEKRTQAGYSVAGKQPDLEIVGQIGADAKCAMRDAVRLQEYGTQRRTLPSGDAAALHHRDEHFDQ